MSGGISESYLPLSLSNLSLLLLLLLFLSLSLSPLGKSGDELVCVGQLGGCLHSDA